MNMVVMMGRLTKAPEVRYGGAKNTAIASFSLAVDRRFKRQGQPDADFFNCTAFGKTAEFIEKYLTKGTKIVIEGELQNNHYKDEKHNCTQYAERILVNSVEFAESKKASEQNTGNATQAAPAPQDDGFMNIPDSIDESLPFV